MPLIDVHTGTTYIALSEGKSVFTCSKWPKACCQCPPGCVTLPSQSHLKSFYVSLLSQMMLTNRDKGDAFQTVSP